VDTGVIRGVLARAACTFRTWDQRYRQRRVLSELPAELLRDIGISRMDAMHEAEKPFWEE
jgi:uncharacterized protein YjiS (DUF1127 family)